MLAAGADIVWFLLRQHAGAHREPLPQAAAKFSVFNWKAGRTTDLKIFNLQFSIPA